MVKLKCPKNVTSVTDVTDLNINISLFSSVQ